MTNKLAVGLVLIIAAFVAYDYSQHDWGYTVFLMRKLTQLIAWMAFWR